MLNKESDKIKCSVGILTFNSGRGLRKPLESVKNFDEIIICDGGSTDDTLKIAEDFGCKIIQQNKKFKNENNTIRDFSGIRNQTLDSAKNDWFFYIDSDEVATPELIAEIKRITNSNPDVFFYGVAAEYLFPGGRLVRYSSSMPSYQIRLFNKKTGAKFIKEVHERLERPETSKTLNLKGRRRTEWSEKDVENYHKKLEYYLSIENKRTIFLNLPQFIKFVYITFLQIMKRIVKMSLNYLRFSKYNRMPFRIEYLSISYHLRLVYINLKKIRVS